MAVTRRQNRSRPIRLLLTGMLAIPLVSLVALWAFATDVTLSGAIRDHDYSSSDRAIGPTLQPLLIRLSAERGETYMWLTAGHRSPRTALDATRHQTDQAVTRAESGLDSVRTLLSPQGQTGLSGVDAELARLGSIRAAIDSGAVSPLAAFEDYSDILDYIFGYMPGSSVTADNTIYQATLGTIYGAYALEMAGREMTLVDGALAAHRPMSGSVGQLFASTVASRRLLFSEAQRVAPPALAVQYASISSSAQYRQLTVKENQISASPAGIQALLPGNSASWQSDIAAQLRAMEKAQGENISLINALSSQLSDQLVTEAALVSGLGLAAVIVSAVVLMRLSRRISGELTGLLGSVRTMADERLPRVVERLRRGEEVDVAAESPPPHKGVIREVTRVAEAFSVVQAAAVAAAVDQAKMRKGISQVFLNLSMRNQSLLHRQLAMLDAMERRTSEPDVLSDLFRLDHLTTRMRRHAEGLIILAGVAPGRGWRDPVPVVDVLRAAIAEVEDYVRVDMLSESPDLVAGTAVSDVIHLIAELVENATAFSPPETRIAVRADRVGSGLVAEIEDRGLGLGDEELADINQRLASTPEFDLADSGQLGLFIVGRLAVRHGVKVVLRHSPYGGITAIVLLPRGVVVWESDAIDSRPALPGPVNETLQAQPTDPGDGQRTPTFGATGRHRLMPVPSPRFSQQRSPAPPEEPEPPQPTASPSPWGAQGPRPYGRAPGGHDQSGTMRDGDQVSPLRSSARPDPASGGSHLGMPVRVPQASIAPQLRAQQAQRGQDFARPAAEPSTRSPEATRAMLLSMQHGWQRGRLDDLTDPDDAPGDATN